MSEKIRVLLEDVYKRQGQGFRAGEDRRYHRNPVWKPQCEGGSAGCEGNGKERRSGESLPLYLKGSPGVRHIFPRKHIDYH